MSILTGRRILITGANRGLGFEMVKQLFEKYTPEKIFAACRNPELADALKKVAKNESRLHIVNIDVTDTKSFPKVAREANTLTNGTGIHILINNAGIFSSKSQSLEDISAEMMLEYYRVNTLGPVLLSQAFLPLLLKANSTNKEQGLIVNFASKIGSIADNQSGGLYASRCSRSALNAATKSLGLDLKNKNMIAVAMNPGWVKTDQGGSDAKLEKNESVSSLLNVLDNLSQDHSGRLIQYDGKILQW